MLYLVSFISGIFTILSPCIWPLLPIVLASSTTGSKRKAFGVVIGLGITFSTFVLGIGYLLKIIPIDSEIFRNISIFIIAFMGITLLIPPIRIFLETLASKFTGKFAPDTSKFGGGFWGGFLTGSVLGLAWTPCAGPILATIATFGATQQIGIAIILMTFSYTTGIVIPLLLLTLVSTKIFATLKKYNKYTELSQRMAGIVMILTALAIYTNFDKNLQVRFLEIFPSYLKYVFYFENSNLIDQEINKILDENVTLTVPTSSNFGKAPEFVGIKQWLNTDLPITQNSLEGKVVIVDFWTYTCVNCIRTLPFVTSWYEKYKNQGLVVIGIHTPEFEFEKKSENVKKAIQEYNITYPVAQDNDYRTWRAFKNKVWPSKYLIDSNGYIRKIYFGEGNYEEIENELVKLLKEINDKTEIIPLEIVNETPTQQITPEIYLGLDRLNNYAGNQIPNAFTNDYSISNKLPLSTWGLEGKWKLTGQYAENLGQAKIRLNSYSKKVHLVVSPGENPSVEMLISISENSTTKNTNDKAKVLIIEDEQLYTLIDYKNEYKSSEIEIQLITPGTRVYAFTFS